MSRKDLTGLGEINALLGRGTEYEGKLTFEGRVRIDGRFSGSIFSDDVLILGDGAEVRADVDVGTLIVRGGELWGQVKARQLVELHAPGRVHGDIHTPQLFIDKGVFFDGTCTMTDTEVHDLSGSSPPTPIPGSYSALAEPEPDDDDDVADEDADLDADTQVSSRSSDGEGSG